jgi:exonuclease I
MKKLFFLFTLVGFVGVCANLIYYHQSLPVDSIEVRSNLISNYIPENRVFYKSNIEDENRLNYYHSFLLAPRILETNSDLKDSCNTIFTFNDETKPISDVDSSHQRSFIDSADGYVSTIYKKAKR